MWASSRSSNVKRKLPPGSSLATVWGMLGVIAAVIVGATAFYRFHSHADWVNALYMSVITISTVGYKESVRLDRTGQLFTIGYILVGWATLVLAGRYAVGYLFEAELGGGWLRRKMSRTIEKISGHTIVCGGGRMGRAAMATLEERREAVVVIESDAETAAELLQQGKLVIEGDATEDEVLTEAGITRARSLISAASGDADNALIVLTARTLNPGLIIAARASSEEAVRKIRKAGANRVLSPYANAGHKLAMSAVAPGAVEFIESAVMGSDYALQEVQVEPNSDLVGKSLQDSRLRNRLGISILAIKRGEDKWLVVPGPDTVLEAKDVLVVLGTLHQIEQLQHTRGLVELETDVD